MSGLDDFHLAAQSPNQYLDGIKRQGKKIIGYFCTYTPEEIIHAAGVHPVRLFSAKEEVSLADAHLQAYCCSLVRGALDDALTGRLDFLDGTVFPHTCDSIQRLSDLWRLNTSFDFFADIVLPVKLDTDSARVYMRAVLEKFRRELAAGMKVDITDGDLQKSMDVFNRIRSALGTVYRLRSENPSLISGADHLALVKASMVMDRDDLDRRLPEVVEDIKSEKFAWDASGKKRLLLVGGICDHPQVHQVIEGSGGVVVGDDLCTGSRWVEGLIPEGDDPITALAQRYLSRPICAAKHASNTVRGERAARLASEHRVDGVVFLLLKFCDPHSFDYPYMKACLDQAGVPSMLYEIEDQLPSEAQLATRFETFIQML